MIAYKRDVAESLHGFVAELDARLGHGDDMTPMFGITEADRLRMSREDDEALAELARITHARAIADNGKDNAAGHLDLKIRERRAAMWGYDSLVRFDMVQVTEAKRPTSFEVAFSGPSCCTARCAGRKTLAEARPETVALAKQLHIQGISLRQISAALAARGYLTSNRKPYVASSMQRMLEQRKRLP